MSQLKIKEFKNKNAQFDFIEPDVVGRFSDGAVFRLNWTIVDEYVCDQQLTRIRKFVSITKFHEDQIHITCDIRIVELEYNLSESPDGVQYYATKSEQHANNCVICINDIEINRK